MKKLIFVLAALLLLSSPCLALYTLTGNVYYPYTTTGVPGATVTLTSVSCTKTTTAGTNGSFTIQCNGDMSGSSVILTAHAPGGFSSGQDTWTIGANTSNQYHKIYVWPTIQPASSLQLPSISTALLGTPGSTIELVAPYQIQATGAPVAVQNAQINMVFNGPIVGVNNVAAPVGSTDITIVSTVPIAGGVQVNVEVNPPRNVPPDFPAESFFDVFFEVEIPESGAELAKVTIQEAIFNQGSGAELSAIPGTTDHLVGEYESPSPYFLVDSQEEWQVKLDADWPDVIIRPLGQEEGDAYLFQLKDWLIEGEPYSPIEPDLPVFIPSELYVYEGDESDPDMPDDAGLVMKWGDENTPDNEERASAWAWDYDDPDLSNCIITVTASPPGPSGINRISLGMQDVNGNIRSWWWNVPTVIGYAPPGTPTTITIDTTKTGITATTPTASGFANNTAFDIKQVQNIIADENANWVASQGAPAPGGQINAIWNYWHNLSVTPKLPSGGTNIKWYVKYSQPPVEIEPGMIRGWDEVSNYNHQPDPIMADDWKCEDDRPITDIHWWGSFKGWTQPHLPPILPIAFRIGIWTDVPATVDMYSHPGQLIWENECTTSVWNFAGYDVDPRCDDPQYPCEENEACFQWAQFLNQDEWFRQEPMADGTPNVYWLSIAPIYAPNVDYADPDFYPWGWKTREHFFNDDAIRITDASQWPPVVGSVWTGGNPVEFPQGVSWDLAFELTTNEPKCPGLSADLSGPAGEPDCVVDLHDFAVMASEWLLTSP